MRCGFATRASPLLACLALLAGCASQPTAPVVTLLHPASRLSVLELPPAVDDDSLRYVFHRDEKEISAAALADDRRNLAQQIDAALQRALAGADAQALRAASVSSIGAEPPMRIGQPLDAVDLAALQAQHPADAYLRVQVTDFGQTPKSWRTAYITFEVVTTAAIGTVLYIHKATRPLAFIYVGTEAAEEFGEGYTGFWLINRLSRPVRLDADLVDGESGAVLWRESETGMADWRWDHLWHMDDATRAGLIQVSTDRSADALVKELEGAP